MAARHATDDKRTMNESETVRVRKWLGPLRTEYRGRPRGRLGRFGVSRSDKHESTASRVKTGAENAKTRGGTCLFGQRGVGILRAAERVELG